MLQLTDGVEDASIAMYENVKALFGWKEINCRIYKISVFYGFRPRRIIGPDLQTFTYCIKNKSKSCESPARYTSINM